jgi:beta-phosphoglucomutase family hydrolase
MNDTKPPKALIFDCDGTLADTMPIHFLAWRSTLQEYGLEFTEDRFYSLGGCPPAKIVAILASEHGIKVDAVTIAEEKELRFTRSIFQVRPIEYVTNVVFQNHKKLPMGVGSGSPRSVVIRVLQHLGIAEHFECVVGSEDTERHKPDPDVFLEVAQRLKVPPSDCHVYEDSDLGIEAARRAGMTWFDVRTVHTPRRHTS